MVERFRQGAAQHGDYIGKGIFYLLHLFVGLIAFTYVQATDEIKQRVARLEQTINERGERIRALESSTVSLNHDLDRIGRDIDQLNHKLDKLLDQSMKPGSHTSFSPV